jgi:hypothetical protein
MLEMGLPPVQIHVMSAISGVDWDEVWADRVEGVPGIRETSIRDGGSPMTTAERPPSGHLAGDRDWR